MDDSRLEREREFHNRSLTDRNRHELNSVYAVLHGSRICYERVLAACCCDKDVLEYGCGPAGYSRGGFSRLLVEHGARLTGIDISDVAVQQALKRAASEGFAATFRVMNAECLEFPAGSFDLVCSVAILHHLDLHRAYSEIARVLKPGGTAVFLEPLGHNPAINLYRRLTPHLRTKDEHPLLMKDLALAGEYFEQVQSRFFTLLPLLAVPFRRTRAFLSLIVRLETCDAWLFRHFPPIRRHAWEVVLTLRRPRGAVIVNGNAQ